MPAISSIRHGPGDGDALVQSHYVAQALLGTDPNLAGYERWRDARTRSSTPGRSCSGARHSGSSSSPCLQDLHRTTRQPNVAASFVYAEALTGRTCSRVGLIVLG
jgi:hypothetical protein